MKDVDAGAKRVRAEMITSGHLVPSLIEYKPYERPPMNTELIADYRARLIRAGVLMPKPRGRA